jgi:hypothetical protein
MRFISLFKTSIRNTFIRFDLSILCCIALTYCLIFTPPTFISKTYFGILSSGAIYFVASKLIFERSDLPSWSFYLLSTPLFAGFAYYAHSYYATPFIWGTLLIGLISSVFISPFWSKRSDADDVWSFQFDILKKKHLCRYCELDFTNGYILCLICSGVSVFIYTLP